MKTYKTDMHNPGDDLPDDEDLMREAENEINDDGDFIDDELPERPDYYWCGSCNKDFARKPPYSECPNCGGIIEEQYY